MNLFDLQGPTFLGVFVALMVGAHAASWALKRLCRAQQARSTTTPDLAPLEAAYLAGGRERAVDAALVGLLRHDMIAVAPKGGGFVVGTQAALNLTGLQAELHHQVVQHKGDIVSLRKQRTAALARIETKLGRNGLLLGGSGGERLCLVLASTLPMAAVVMIGLMKIAIGLARHKPVVLLVILTVIAGFWLAHKAFSLPLRSALGEAALEKLRRRNAALQATTQRRSGDIDEASLMLAVGLFGTGVLAGAELLWMRQGFTPNRSSDGGSGGCGSSSGCDGGGGGGGGCGGCGG